MLNKEEKKVDKHTLKNLIKNLNNKQDYLVILKFLMDNKIKYTENSNGIFFNLKQLTNELILELIDIVNNLTNQKVNIPIIEETIKQENYTDNLHVNYKKYIINE